MAGKSDFPIMQGKNTVEDLEKPLDKSEADVVQAMKNGTIPSDGIDYDALNRQKVQSEGIFTATTTSTTNSKTQVVIDPNERPKAGEVVRDKNGYLSPKYQNVNICYQYGCRVEIVDRRTGETVSFNGHLMKDYALSTDGSGEIVRTTDYVDPALRPHISGPSTISSGPVSGDVPSAISSTGLKKDEPAQPPQTLQEKLKLLRAAKP